MGSGEPLCRADARWVAAQVTQKSLEWSPYRYDAAVVRRNDPNKKRRWLIPLVLLAQITFKVLVLDRVLEEDGITGDAYGPYDPEFIQEERERIAREKVRGCLTCVRLLLHDVSTVPVIVGGIILWRT